METASPVKRTLLAAIFLSPSERRPRAGWRLLIQTILLVLLGFCLGLPLLIAAGVIGLHSENLLFLEVSEVFAVTLSVFLARRFLDKRSFLSLGLRRSWQALYDMLAGIVIAGLMFGLIYLLEWSLDWLTFEGFAWQVAPRPTVIGQTLLALAIFVLVGWNEELLSRGYHLQTIASGLNLTWGVIISSAVFGVLHLGNPHATWMSAAGILLAGAFLAFGWLQSGQLWLPIGLHVGWNFFEGVIFGFPVSGLDFYHLTRISVSGPELLTGGAFGPEAGLVILPALALGAVLVYGYSALC